MPLLYIKVSCYENDILVEKKEVDVETWVEIKAQTLQEIYGNSKTVVEFKPY